MTTTPPIIYSVGTLVEVDNTKTGYIIEIEDTNDDIIRFKISYIVGNEIEEHVNETRCRPVSLCRASSTRSGAIRHALPQSTDPPPLTIAPLPGIIPTVAAAPPISIHTRDYLCTPRGLPFPRQRPPFLQRCVRPEQMSGTDYGPSREDGTEDTDFGGGCGGRCGG